MINPFHRIYLAVILTLLFPLNVFAFQGGVTPGEVKPGDVFLIKISGDISNSARADFRGSTVDFYKLNEKQQIALVPVDINTPPGKYDVSVKYGDETRIIDIYVKAHKFKTVKLTLPEGKVSLSPENQKRAAKEAELLNSIWPVNTGKQWGRDFIFPTDTEISEVFGVKRIMNEKKTSVHRGMDFRGKTGTPVKAINSGTVVLTDDLFFGGNTLIVDHGMGLYSVYMHLSEFRAVKNENVNKGRVIGLVGSSGRVTGPHLHMSVKLNGTSINPESLFWLALDEQRQSTRLNSGTEAKQDK